MSTSRPTPLVVRAYLDQHCPARTALPPAPPTVREVTGWITRRPDSLTEDERPRLKAIFERCPDLQAASDLVHAFAAMMSQVTDQKLPNWITSGRAAELPGLSSFARGLEQDLDAVTRGLTSRWNFGPVEGRVNHIILWNKFVRFCPVLLWRTSMTGSNLSMPGAAS